MSNRILISLVIGATFVSALAASAQTAGDADRGRETSERRCASCHNTSESGQSSALDSAPAFAAVAALTSTTSISLNVLLQTPHQRMPSNVLTRGEVNDVVAYILSLRR